MKNRNEMLKNFLKNKELLKITGLEPSELEAVNYTDKTNSILLEAIKRMLQSYCSDEADNTVIRNINISIENNIKESLR